MLTKLFVVLLVVLSLMLTAGTVVFVGQVQDYKAQATAAQAQLSAAERRAELVRSEAESARQSAQAAVAEVNRQLEDSKNLSNSLQQEKIDKDAQLAAGQSRLATQTVENMTLAGGLKAAQDTQSRLQEQINELRSTNDRVVAQNAQLNQSVTDLTNRLDVTERERKLLAEQLSESKNQVQRQASMLRDAGVPLAQFESQPSRASAPAINGVVREVQGINGVLYASISVGSADSVAKGMEFKVVSRETGAFLGILTVDMVELNAATGRLRGDKINDIRPGAEVKTQF